MDNNLDKVRYSHAGHDFHFLWTARRALRLLNPQSNLVAVSIEGISSEDSSSDEAGLLSIDTAEYYGSEKIEDAEKIKYFQLKYSTTASEKDWTASELSPHKKGTTKGTIVSFAKNFQENFSKYGHTILENKFEYCFVTNRPINKEVKQLLELNNQGKSFNDLPVKVQKVYTRFFEDCGLEKELFVLFLKLLKFLELEAPRSSQSASLEVEVNAFIPEFDADVSIKLKELVHSRAMPEYTKNPTIKKETIFHLFGITKIEDLLPASAQFEKLDNYIPREQEDSIIKEIFNATSPVVIHASGGIGKSSFVQNLITHLPKDSKIVIFDGFANGSYRSPKDQRHLHKNGLVQIINEFAFDGLCLPILPTHATSDNFLKIFYSRLEQIVSEVKKVSSYAFVVIVLDAADNTEMASQEYNERASFAKDLLQENPPDGCKIVALARTERLDILNLPHSTIKIELKSFSREETKSHLETKFADINDGELVEFHKLTFGNPRVQSYLLSSNESLRTILKRLGQKGLSSDKLIESQLESSLADIKGQSHFEDEINMLCQTLTLLPPMVPIEILEVSTNISRSLIHSFASDMGLALLIKDDNIQFRDEPVESWFKETFKPDKPLYELLVQRLISLSKSNPYVAMTLPRILFGAEQYETLYESVYNSSDITIDDPIQRESIILENITYAIKLAKKENDFKNLAKLLFEASKVVSSKDRHSEFIFENSDLIATLVGAEFINDFLYRGNYSSVNGILYAHSALMLAMEPRFKAEARSFLRLTNEYLIEWSRLQKKEMTADRINDKDIANTILSYLYLFDEQIAISELNRWRSKKPKLRVITIIIEHLIEQNQDTIIRKLLDGLKKYPYLLCASVIRLYQSGKRISKEDVENSLKFLLTQKKSEELQLSVICIVELSIIHKVNQKPLISFLKKHFPPLHAYVPSPIRSKDVDERKLLLRYISLIHVLEGKPISVDDFAPNDISTDRKKDLDAVYGKLFPFYELRVKLLFGSSLDDKIIISEMSSYMDRVKTENWRYSRNYNHRDLLFIAAYVCMDILILCGETKQYKLISNWLQSLDNYFINDYVWIKLIEQTRFIDTEAALYFGELAYKTIESTKKTSHTSYEYANLSRAILPINKEDARAYFEIAIHANSTLGDDARYRLDTLCSITNNIDDCHRDPKLAYEFLKLCEMIEDYDGHKFQWYTVIESIGNIDKTSSLAFVSRLNYRGTVSFVSTLSPLLNRLLKQKKITPKTYASLFILTQNDSWSLNEGIENILSVSVNKDDVQEAIDFLIRDFYLEYNERDAYYAEKIKKVLDKYNLENKLINDLISINMKEEEHFSHSSNHTNNEINWDEVFLDCKCIEKQEIKEALTRFWEKREGYTSSSFFYEEMRKRVATNERVKHLDNIFDLLSTDELEKYSADWTNIAVKKHMPTLIDKSLKQNKDILGTSYGIKNKLDSYEKLSNKTRKEIFELLLENSLNNIEEYDSYGLLAIADEVSCFVSSDDNIDILSFGIEQFKDDIEEDASDGSWSDSLIPPRDINDAIGAFIYTYLGLTRPENRWRAMHTVRRLCVLGEVDILESILNQLDNHNIKSFTDVKYKFYDMHSKLYLFMSLARGAKENPEVLLKFSNIFTHYALDWLPHVLIRKYCAEIAIELESFSANTYSHEIYEKLKNVNVSPYKIEMSTPKYERQSIIGDKEASISLGIDWEPYWFNSLARAFDIREKDITYLVEDWIINKWGYDKSFTHWEKDLRAKHKIYRENDTYASHGSYPREDDLDFYLIYHAMFCVAGDLLRDYPLRIDSYEDDLWDEWLRSHTLARDDGKWVSDRKDPMPIDLHVNLLKEQKNDDWEFSVQPKDFDRCLRFREKDFKFLPISGDWKLNHEEINISSTLVNNKTSFALLRAYQTTTFPQYVYLPRYNDESFNTEVIDKQFKTTGWIVIDSSGELGADEFDPLAKIYYSPRSPAPGIVRLHKLKPDEEKRIWKDSSGDVVFISEIWGNHIEFIQYGKRLQVDYGFLLKILKNLNKDLLVNVEIKRKKIYGKDDYSYSHPYFKLFLFKKDGTVHELYKNYKIR